MNLTVNDLGKLTHLELRNAAALGDASLAGVSTDSRATKRGDIFVALKGERFDGHKFVFEALTKGARAIVVDAASGVAATSPVTTVVVNDTTRALGELARLYRMKFKLPVLAIGGSNGKTTTKEMVSAVLATKRNVLSTQGNLNNHIGVPLTLFRLQQSHSVAIVEVGTNHPGEIEYLCSILHPTHGLITNIGKEHLEFFTSLQGVAEEEGALFACLNTTKNAVAFVSADDPYVVSVAPRVRKRITYGFNGKRFTVQGKILSTDASGCAAISFLGRSMKRWAHVKLAIPGRHNAANALAAAAVGLHFNVPPVRIREALEAFKPPGKRMEMLHVGGITLFDDTYNANPDSTVAALRTLAAAQAGGKRIAVLADMLELGASSEEEHARVGREVASLGIDYLLTWGTRAKAIHDASRMKFALHYEEKNMLAEFLAELVSPGDIVLVKGSRGMKMEDVVTFLRERLQPPVLT